MSLTRSDLSDELQLMLKDAGQKFAPSDYERHLDHAVLDLARVRPRTLADTLTLIADQSEYTAPADMIRPKFSDWGHLQRQQYRPWDKQYPLHLPCLSVIESGGVKTLLLTPAPSAGQISCLGKTYRYFYYAAHTLADDPANTTVQACDKHLLLLGATVKAMTELASGGSVKPIQLHKGMGSSAKSAIPSEWVKWLSEEYRRVA